jgi:hypothetical protein
MSVGVDGLISFWFNWHNIYIYIYIYIQKIKKSYFKKIFPALKGRGGCEADGVGTCYKTKRQNPFRLLAKKAKSHLPLNKLQNFNLKISEGEGTRKK